MYTYAQERNKQPSSVVRAVNNPLQYSIFQPTYFYFYVRTYVRSPFPKVGSCQLGYDGPATRGPGTSRLPNFGLGKGPSPLVHHHYGDIFRERVVVVFLCSVHKRDGWNRYG